MKWMSLLKNPWSEHCVHLTWTIDFLAKEIRTLFSDGRFSWCKHLRSCVTLSSRHNSIQFQSLMRRWLSVKTFACDAFYDRLGDITQRKQKRGNHDIPPAEEWHTYWSFESETHAHTFFCLNAICMSFRNLNQEFVLNLLSSRKQ